MPASTDSKPSSRPWRPTSGELALAIVASLLFGSLLGGVAPRSSEPTGASVGSPPGGGLDHHAAKSGSSIRGASSELASSALTLAVGTAPDGVAFDPLNGMVYVANSGSDNVSVIDGTTVVASISVGARPEGVAVDPANGYIYVTDYAAANVSVIDGATNTVVDTIPVGYSPTSIAYDGWNGGLYVVNLGSANVSVIDGATDRLIDSIPVGPNPEGIAFDGANGYLYVDSYISSNVTVIDGATDNLRAPVTVPWPASNCHNCSYPSALAFDSWYGTIYLAKCGANNVTVIDGTTDTIGGTAGSGACPDGAAFDNESGFVYVANCGASNLTVINTTSNAEVRSIPTGNCPDGVAFDHRNLKLYVVNFNADTVSVISTPAADARYPVAFREFGLNAGTLWSVRFAGSTEDSVTSSLTFYERNGSDYVYSVGKLPSYRESPVVGTVNVTGATVTVPLNFTFVPPPPTPLWFNATGLPPGTDWSVTVYGAGTYAGSTSNHSTTTTVGFGLPAGFAGNYAVPAVGRYVPTPDSGILSISPAGKPVAVNLSFSPLGSNAPPISVGLFEANPSRLALGGNVTLTVGVYGGTTPFTFAFSGLPAGCTSQNRSTITCEPAGQGAFDITVRVSDELGRSAGANTSLTVGPPTSTATGPPNASSTGASGSFTLTMAELWGALGGAVGTTAILLAISTKRRTRDP
ncbi:MAG: YncE family protein [Thermoplasmata archaeon]|nr:YncE family protein [Thermoplasmata archaeon]